MESNVTLQDVLDESRFTETAKDQIRDALGDILEQQVQMMFSNKGPRFQVPSGRNKGESMIIQAFVELCVEWRKEGRKRRRLLTPAEIYQDIGAPSAFGKPSGWSKWQENDERPHIMCLRPAACSWLNIQIIHPVFHEIVRILDNGVPTTRDWKMAAELCSTMPQAFVVENARRDIINEIFNKYIPSDASAAIGVQCIADKFDTDGTCPKAGTNIEYKNEKGKGDSDPYMQNIGYYIQYWGSHHEVQNKHCCPWMLIEIIGQEIGISGAVYSYNVPCSQPLSANVPFLPVPNDTRMQLQQARLCSALRYGFTALYEFYTLNPTTDPQPGFPYERNFIMNGSSATLTYLRPLVQSPGRMLFIAKVDDKEDNLVLVKFTACYCEEAHALAADNDLAPGLHHVKELSSGFVMVVMEYEDKFCRWWGRDGAESSESLKQELEKLLRLFAARDIVHGDLRGPNILIQGDKIRVIDFDWAGKHGVATYPIALNPSETWADGVDVGCPIMKEHDAFMVQQLCHAMHSRSTGLGT